MFAENHVSRWGSKRMKSVALGEIRATKNLINYFQSIVKNGLMDDKTLEMKDKLYSSRSSRNTKSYYEELTLLFDIFIMVHLSSKDEFNDELSSFAEFLEGKFNADKR